MYPMYRVFSLYMDGDALTIGLQPLSKTNRKFHRKKNFVFRS